MRSSSAENETEQIRAREEQSRLETKALARLKNLYATSKLLMDIESLEKTLPAVLEEASRTLPIRTAVVIHKRKETFFQFTWSAPGVSAQEKSEAEAQAQTTFESVLRGTVARNGSASDDRHLVVVPKGQGSVPTSIILIPLVMKHWPIFGALQVETIGSADEADLTFVNTLANQMAVALNNFHSWQQKIFFREKAEALLKASAAELTRSNKALEDFAAIAAHDLREPLRTVVSFIRLLAKRNEGNLDNESLEFIGMVVDGAERMKALIDDLLTLARVKARILDLAPVDCNHIVETVLRQLGLSIEEAKAVVTFDKLPQLVVDPLQLTQLFQNIISNALKYRSQKPPRVHISCEKEDEHWRFKVQDNGIGIDMQFAERIFDVFRRLHGRGEYSGTGLGLNICKTIVERHQGRIWVESIPGEGSTFYFTISSTLRPQSPGDDR